MKTNNVLAANAVTATKELAWFSAIVTGRGAISFSKDVSHPPLDSIAPPDITNDTSPYADTIRQFNMTYNERFMLILSLVPHLQPELLDILLMKNSVTDHPFTQLGGYRTALGNFLPTGETAVFLLAGNDLEKRYQLMQLFEPHHFFTTQNILKLQQVAANEPRLNGVLAPSAEFQVLLTSGEHFKPDFTANFPAKLLTIGLTWDDLVVGD